MAETFTPVPALKNKVQSVEEKEPFFLDIRTPGFALHLDIKFSRRLWTSRVWRAMTGFWQRITFKDQLIHVKREYDIERIHDSIMIVDLSANDPKASADQGGSEVLSDQIQDR